MERQLTKLDPNALLPIDWERVEADYRAGVLSVREIAKRAGCSHTAIQKRAREVGWDRDLNVKIKAKADALVAKHTVATRLPQNELHIIKSNAEVLATVQLVHRDISRRGRTLALAQLAEVEAINGSPEIFAQVYDALSRPGEMQVQSLKQIADHVVSLPKRQRALREALDNARVAIALEREALSMDDRQPPPADPSSFESLVDLATLAIAAGNNAHKCRG